MEKKMESEMETGITTGHIGFGSLHKKGLGFGVQGWALGFRV